MGGELRRGHADGGHVIRAALRLVTGNSTAIVVALMVASAAAGAYTFHRQALIQKGYDTAMGEIRENETDRLREQIQATARLVGVVKGLTDAADLQKQAIAGFRAGQRDAVQRLRDQKADFDERVTTATADALRRYAQATDGDLERARADVERYGLEAVQCSIAAHTLKGFEDARP